MNCDGKLFMNFSSWTNNASILWTFHELFMNVHEQFIKSWTTFTRGNNLKASFSYMSQNVKKKFILVYLGGPQGVFNDHTGLILISSYPLTHIYVHVK